ncbi:MAG TPA: right-handed parallel beta-helix repeat-containing protein [Gaiellaceae bacterium]|nr:right-handed parallel beta-helix repeat-containing protein [Gaiellaceae bacterium]
MSYTLRGRIETRLAASLPALALALALHRWWAVELVALMLVVGVLLDTCVYHRALAYQPAWAALPLGALELALVYGLMRALEIAAPLGWALALYGSAWLSAQLCAHALFPRLRLEYAQSGGELGAAGAATAAAVALAVAGGLGADYAVRPPTVHLHGTVRGPLVIRHAETLTGGVVLGGIRVRANGVRIEHVTVVGGDDAIDVEHAQHVVIDDVRLIHFRYDGIRVLDAGVMIHDCSVSAPRTALATGVLIAYSMGRPMSMVDGCTIVGTREGISTHSSMVDVTDNHVVGTTARAISLSEMSMDSASGNRVEGAKGIGIVCMDHSVCEIHHNTIAGAEADGVDDPSRAGVAIESYFYAQARVSHNTVIASPGGVRALDESVITR